MLIFVAVACVTIGAYTNYNRYFIFNLNMATTVEAEDNAMWLLWHWADKRGSTFLDANRKEVFIDDELDLTEVAYVRFSFYDGVQGEHKVIAQYNMRYCFDDSLWRDLKYLPVED